MREEGPVTAKLCRLAIRHRSTLTGSQGQGCPSNELQVVSRL